MRDCLIIGGGVIGLSVAYELAARGVSAHIIDRGQPGQESSWAGAGILPPYRVYAGATAYEQLSALTCELHPQWAAQLREEAGLDNGYTRCGGIYLARDATGQAALAREVESWKRQGLRIENVSGEAICRLEPQLAAAPSAYLLPDEAQLRNPRHLKALQAACLRRGVRISPGVEAEDFLVADGCIVGVRTVAGKLSADSVCICGGAWSQSLAARLRVEPVPRIHPVRGQMVLLACDQPLVSRVVNDGPQYLVPRQDGRVLVGSTEEDVGFDNRTTGGAISDLLRFAQGLLPALAAARFERCWSGLRPGTADGMPYLGRLPGLDNAYIAAGHYRQGLHLSPATAVVMADLICGRPAAVDLIAFRVDRTLGSAS